MGLLNFPWFRLKTKDLHKKQQEISIKQEVNETESKTQEWRRVREPTLCRFNEILWRPKGVLIKEVRRRTAGERCGSRSSETEKEGRIAIGGVRKKAKRGNRYSQKNRWRSSSRHLKRKIKWKFLKGWMGWLDQEPLVCLQERRRKLCQKQKLICKKL